MPGHWPYTRFFGFCLFLVLSTSFHGTQALVNFTVDDASLFISYSGAWTRIEDDDNYDYDGGHMVTADPSAKASIKIKFVNLYFFSAQWPYPVSTAVTVGGKLLGALDLQDPNATPQTDYTYGPSRRMGLLMKTGNPDEDDLVEFSLGGAPHAVVDMLLFEVTEEVLETLTASSSSIPSSPPLIPPAPTITTTTLNMTPTSLLAVPSQSQDPDADLAPPSPSGLNSTKIIALVIGLVTALLSILFGVLVWNCIFRRRRRARTHQTVLFPNDFQPSPAHPVRDAESVARAYSRSITTPQRSARSSMVEASGNFVVPGSPADQAFAQSSASSPTLPPPSHDDEFGTSSNRNSSATYLKQLSNPLRVTNATASSSRNTMMTSLPTYASVMGSVDHSFVEPVPPVPEKWRSSFRQGKR